MHIRLLCGGNSCRSILAEATFNHLAPAGWRATSAGSWPTGHIHPRSLALLAREGIATAGYASKSWLDLPTPLDVVIAVGAPAAGEACPTYLAPVPRVCWAVADPAQAIGTEAEIDAAFEAAYAILRHRIEAFFALPAAQLPTNPQGLKQQLDRIAQLRPVSQPQPVRG